MQLYTDNPIAAYLKRRQSDFPGEHWDIVAVAEKAVVRKEISNLLYVVVEAGIAFMLGMGLIAFIISRRLTRKIRGFLPLVERIGGGDLNVRLPEDSRDEVGSLAQEFNTMLDHLQETLTSRDNLEKLIAEKDFLMKELNHRVKNNLAMIISLINLKDSMFGEEVDLSDLTHQIEAIRIVHDKLYQTQEIAHIHLKEYFQELLSTIFSFSKYPVTIETDIDSKYVPTKTAVSLGLIVNEIATNAIKHGFTDKEEARFTVSLTEDRTVGHNVLTLSNTGNPFPRDVDFNNPDTLGLRLISALVDQLNGTIELRREPHPVFTILFPLDQIER